MLHHASTLWTLGAANGGPLHDKDCSRVRPPRVSAQGRPQVAAHRSDKWGRTLVGKEYAREIAPPQDPWAQVFRRRCNKTRLPTSSNISRAQAAVVPVLQPLNGSEVTSMEGEGRQRACPYGRLLTGARAASRICPPLAARLGSAGCGESPGQVWGVQ